jgi:EEF1A lysine methyltransferase 2
MIDYKKHWDNDYSGSEINKLGWFENTPQPSLDLILSCGLNRDASILDVGSGTTSLIKYLLQDDYSNIIVTDVSKVTLDNAKKLLDSKESEKVRWIVDDITNPKIITRLTSIDLWHDRTVLYFLIKEELQQAYLNTLKMLVRKGGFVIIALPSLEIAKKISGPGVKNYDSIMIEEFLGREFRLLKHFNYSFKLPTGNLRPYVYTLFQRIT